MEEDDLYEGFHASHVALKPVFNARAPTGSISDNVARPMTSVKGAGFQSTPGSGGGNRAVFDPLNQINRGPAPPLQKRSETSPESMAREIEKKVNDILNSSALCYANGDYSAALEQAKDAAKQERVLCKHREKSNLSDSINYDLTYAVLFNLANMLVANNMTNEALNAYAAIVKNKQFPHAGRLRVNMGNIYYRQKKYPAALKMYRMAVDQIGNISKEIKYKILRNIGNCLLRSGQFPEAIVHFESIMENNPDPHSGLNLIICYYALGDTEKMKKSYSQLLSVPQYLESPEENFIVEETDGRLKPFTEQDDLKVEQVNRQKEYIRLVRTASLLLAPKIEGDLAAGYDWIVELLRSASQENPSTANNTLAYVAMEMEIAKGVDFLKHHQFSQAMEIFRAFEKKEAALLDQAATNLSFLYFLEGDYKNAEKHAELAIKADRYNARALVNRANCLFVRGDLESAKEIYLEAIGVEADCVEAIYNLGLVNKRMDNLGDAMQAFKKLHRIIPRSAFVLYQIANIYELMQNHAQAIEWFKILLGTVSTDSRLLARLGNLYALSDDNTQSFHNYLDSYHCYPCNMEVITWLGVWYVKASMYEQAITFFERAAVLEPKEVKWKLMVASCYRRMSNYSAALDLYKAVHAQDPENVECLRYLCTITKDLGDKTFEEYSKRLRKVERNLEANEAPQYAEPDRDYDRQEAEEENQEESIENAGVESEPIAAERPEPDQPVMRQSKQVVPKNDDDDDVGELLPL